MKLPEPRGQMIGIGESHAAISIVNAIPNGKGGGLGVKLPVSVKVVLTQNEDFFVNKKKTKKHLASITVIKLLNYFKNALGAEITISSQIPIAKGLKSSSAIQVATALAVINALNKKIPPKNKFLKLLVQAARTAKVTITGGLDDLASCAYGGLVLTDNMKEKILLQQDMVEYDVVLIIPKKSILTSKVKFKSSPLINKLFAKIHEIAFHDPFLALTLNGLLYMDLTGLDSKPIRSLLRQPVIAAGLTGKGPAIAIVCEEEYTKQITTIAEQFGPVLITKVTNQGIKE